ncbi:unnamed protein product [Sphenostylis stenocarpa]|uniref:Uncharacterized protein n=1 Tax=Sphenostylis stenocarpa TaxID=92480 RepID=A0AA86W077_9FABA|nr:unnamed protein product [Sphenostylis stenocarpa]
MRANASAANFGGHANDKFCKVKSSLLGSEALSKLFDIRRGSRSTIEAPVTFTLSWLIKKVKYLLLAGMVPWYTTGNCCETMDRSNYNRLNCLGKLIRFLSRKNNDHIREGIEEILKEILVRAKDAIVFKVPTVTIFGALSGRGGTNPLDINDLSCLNHISTKLLKNLKKKYAILEKENRALSLKLVQLEQEREQERGRIAQQRVESRKKTLTLALEDKNTLEQKNANAKRDEEESFHASFMVVKPHDDVENLIPPQMAPKMFACIYDNGDMIPNPENGVLFKSDTCIMVHLHRDFTFSQLIEIVLQRAQRDPTNPPPVLHFRFPTQICGRHATYITTKIEDDNDLDGAMDITEANPTLRSLEICTTYNTGHN